jgi:hypothetical protein
MARRRRNAPAVPPAPKPPKVPRPQGKELRALYKGLMTLSASNRINTLAYALQWFDKAVTYMMSHTKGQPLSADVMKALERAVKARKIGISSTQEGEKETAFCTAIRLYEMACAGVKPVSLDKMYKVFEQRKVKLEARQKRIESQFGTAIQSLAQATGGELRLMVYDSPKTRQIVPQSKEIVYNRDGARLVVDTIRRQGLLAAFVAEMDMMARCLSTEVDGNGNYHVAAEKYMEAQTRLLKSFVRYAGTPAAPARLVKFGAKAEHGVLPTPQPPAPRQTVAAGAPRVGKRGPAKGPKVFGLYEPNSTIGILLDRLKDAQEKKVVDILAGVSAADPMGRLEALGKEVKRHSIGEFVWGPNKETVQLRLIK